jgi:pyruvate formate lyase activating enzyme
MFDVPRSMFDVRLSPVYGFLKNPSMVDFEGHLAAVFFLSGCNFRCGFCHNAELMGQHRPGLSWERLKEVCREFAGNWVTGAVVTGGEPTLSKDLPALLDFLKRFGWKIKLDTNGSNPAMLRSCLSRVDYVAMDIKTAPSHYPHLTGFHDTGLLHESAELIRREAADYEFRTTIIESAHSDELVDEMAAFIGTSRRYILQPFIPSDRLPNRQYHACKRTSPDRLTKVAERMSHCSDEVRVRGR